MASMELSSVKTYSAHPDASELLSIEAAGDLNGILDHQLVGQPRILLTDSLILLTGNGFDQIYRDSEAEAG